MTYRQRIRGRGSSRGASRGDRGGGTRGRQHEQPTRRDSNPQPNEGRPRQSPSNTRLNPTKTSAPRGGAHIHRKRVSPDEFSEIHGRIQITPYGRGRGGQRQRRPPGSADIGTVPVVSSVDETWIAAAGNDFGNELDPPSGTQHAWKSTPTEQYASMDNTLSPMDWSSDPSGYTPDFATALRNNAFGGYHTRNMHEAEMLQPRPSPSHRYLTRARSSPKFLHHLPTQSPTPRARFFPSLTSPVTPRTPFFALAPSHAQYHHPPTPPTNPAIASFMHALFTDLSMAPAPISASVAHLTLHLAHLASFFDRPRALRSPKTPPPGVLSLSMDAAHNGLSQMRRAQEALCQPSVVRKRLLAFAQNVGWKALAVCAYSPTWRETMLHDATKLGNERIPDTPLFSPGIQVGEKELWKLVGENWGSLLLVSRFGGCDWEAGFLVSAQEVQRAQGGEVGVEMLSSGVAWDEAARGRWRRENNFWEWFVGLDGEVRRLKIQPMVHVVEQKGEGKWKRTSERVLGMGETEQRNVKECAWKEGEKPKWDPMARTARDDACWVCGDKDVESVQVWDDRKQEYTETMSWCECTMQDLVGDERLVEIRMYPVEDYGEDINDETFMQTELGGGMMGVRTLVNLPANIVLAEFVGELSLPTGVIRRDTNVAGKFTKMLHTSHFTEKKPEMRKPWLQQTATRDIEGPRGGRGSRDRRGWKGGRGGDDNDRREGYNNNRRSGRAKARFEQHENNVYLFKKHQPANTEVRVGYNISLRSPKGRVISAPHNNKCHQFKKHQPANRGGKNGHDAQIDRKVAAAKKLLLTQKDLQKIIKQAVNGEKSWDEAKDDRRKYWEKDKEYGKGSRVLIDATVIGNWTRYVRVSDDLKEANVEFGTVSIGGFRKLVCKVKSKPIGWGSELVVSRHDSMNAFSRRRD